MMKINTANNPTEARGLINHYEEIIRTQHKQVLQYIYKQYIYKQYIYKQGEILKIFKETENFFDSSEQSRLRIYLKLQFIKYLKVNVRNFQITVNLLYMR